MTIVKYLTLLKTLKFLFRNPFAALYQLGIFWGYLSELINERLAHEFEVYILLMNIKFLSLSSRICVFFDVVVLTNKDRGFIDFVYFYCDVTAITLSS